MTRRRPIWRRRLLIGLTVAVVLLLASFVPFLWPPTEEPERADAVVVLSGDHGERLPIAMRLLRSGAVRTLVFVGTPDSGVQLELCRDGSPDFEIVCLRPDPDGTLPEARSTAELARSRGWDRLVVVTSTYHIMRAGMLFRRCVDADIAVTGARPPLGRKAAAREIWREWWATGYFLVFERGC